MSAALASDSHGQCQFDQTHKLHLQSLGVYTYTKTYLYLSSTSIMTRKLFCLIFMFVPAKVCFLSRGEIEGFQIPSY